MGSEENEPQIKAPRVEGVYTYALQGIRGCGVENPQGFGIDERGFVVLNPAHLSQDAGGDGMRRKLNLAKGRLWVGKVKVNSMITSIG